jgi:large subunit ribosomal protein L11
VESRVKILVEGGKASAGPPLGPALGPLGVNVGQVVAKINETTASFAGVKVPVSVIVNKKTREFKIEVGTPPTAALIKKELGAERGAKAPGTEVVGNLTLEQVVKITKLKYANRLAKDLAAAVKETLGTCVSLGVTVDGKDPREVQKEIEKGEHAEELK